MKKYSVLCAALAAISIASISAAQNSKQGVRQLSNIPLNLFPGSPSSGSAIYGWTSPAGKEYAVMGMRNGTAVVNITNPTSPVINGHIVGSTSLWHEVVCHNGYAYAISDSVGAGMQIINLNNLDSTGTISLSGTYQGGGLATVHTIEVNPTNNHLYLNGSNLAGGGLVVLNATNPTSPVQVGSWSARYVHDCVVTNYTTGIYAGKEVVFACCGRSGIYILDVTNKASISVLGSIDLYASGGYTHSGVLSADKRYFFANDELDESDGLKTTTTTYVFDVQNLSNPTLVGQFNNPIGVIDHNTCIRDGYIFLSAYEGGVRVYNAANPLGLSEAGYFDTYPSGNSFNFNGVWGIYAYFPSGNMVASDMNTGLWVFDPSEAMGQGAPPVDYTILDGLYMSGSTKSIRKSDDTYFQQRWSARLDRDGVPNTSAIFGFTSTITPANFVDLTVEAKTDNAVGGVFTVQAKNWTTNQWVNVGTFSATNTDSTFAVSGLAGAQYVNPTGRIECRLICLSKDESHLPFFTTSIDMVRAIVRRS